MKMLVEMFTNGPGALFNWSIVGILLYGVVRSVLIRTKSMDETSLAPIAFSALTGLLGFFVGGEAVLYALKSISPTHQAAALWTGFSAGLFILQHTAVCGILLYALYVVDTMVLAKRRSDAVAA